MTRVGLAVLMIVAAACGGEDSGMSQLSRTPVSVRGWITDVAGAQRGETMEMEIARRTQLFQAAQLWVENSQYSSGGIAENGSFLVLDVPSGNAVIGFNAPGAETAKIVLQNIPPNADVLIPSVVLQNGGAKVLDPNAIRIRVPASVDRPTDTGKTATVAGYTVRVIDTPLNQLTDRRDYPMPAGFRPVATVK